MAWLESKTYANLLAGARKMLRETVEDGVVKIMLDEGNGGYRDPGTMRMFISMRLLVGEASRMFPFTFRGKPPPCRKKLRPTQKAASFCGLAMMERILPG